MLIHEEDVSYAKHYSINPNEYTDIPVSVNLFSNRVYNRLKGNNINFVSELINTTPNQLKLIGGFGSRCLFEVDEFCRSLKNTSHSYLSSESVNSQSTVSINTTLLSLEEIAPVENNSKCNWRKRMPSIIKQNIESVIMGDFSFMDDDKMFIAVPYVEALSDLGQELAMDCVYSPENITHIINSLNNLIINNERYQKIVQLLNILSVDKVRNKAFPYIKAYTSDEETRQLLYSAFPNENSKLRDLVESDGYSDDKLYETMTNFLKWCNFDLAAIIKSIFSSMHLNERENYVLNQRATHHTLEQIGTKLNVTRERIRQMESKVKRRFAKLQTKARIIMKVSAELDGKIVIPISDIAKFSPDRAVELTFLLESFDNSNYTYDKQYEVFVVGDNSLLERCNAAIENYPDVVKSKEIDTMLSETAELEDISIEMLLKAFKESYQLTGDVYHRSRLSLASVYKYALRNQFPNGIKISDSKQIKKLRNYIVSEYGDVGLPKNDRAIIARISDIGVLCDRGTYILKQDRYLSKGLLRRIKSYISNSKNSIFLIHTIFSVFEEELKEEGVNNRYYLQGILREEFGDKYYFRRDYISKDPNLTSVYTEITEYIRKTDHLVTKQEICNVFPGITDIIINFAVTDHGILNYFGEYYHASKLNVYSSEKDYLDQTISDFLSKENVIHFSDIYTKINAEKPEIFTRNYATFQYRAYSMMEYLFDDKYQFSRPFIAINGVEINRPNEQLHEMVYGEDEHSISNIRDFARDIHLQITCLLDYVNSCNDNFLIVNTDQIMSIDKLGINKDIAMEVEKAVLEEVTQTVPIYDLSIWCKLPKISVHWTDWLVYSVLKKWSSSLEVGTSNPQIRYAVPLVAPAGKLDVVPFANLTHSGTTSITVDDIDDIDSLLADIIDDDILEDL